MTYETPCTVKYVLIKCKDFILIRKLFFKVKSSSDYFENVNMDDVVSFLRETGLYQRIWSIETI